MALPHVFGAHTYFTVHMCHNHHGCLAPPSSRFASTCTVPGDHDVSILGFSWPPNPLAWTSYLSQIECHGCRRVSTHSPFLWLCCPHPLPQAPERASAYHSLAGGRSTLTESSVVVGQWKIHIPTVLFITADLLLLWFFSMVQKTMVVQDSAYIIMVSQSLPLFLLKPSPHFF